MSGEAAATPAAAPSEPTASPERAGADAPVDGGQAASEGAQPTDGQQTPTQGAEGQQPEGEGQGGKPTPEHRSVQGRISHYQKETVREREARIRAEAERDTLARLLRDGGSRQPEQQAPQAPPAPPAAPNPANYKGGKFDEQYVEDFAAWKAERAVEAALEKRDSAAKEAERHRSAEAAMAAGKARLDQAISAAEAEAQGANGEYFQNAARVLDLAYVPQAQGGLPRHVVDLITESENPVHVAELLGRQPERLRELRALTPLQAARQIGVLDNAISANLKRQSAPAPTPTPKPAPTPSPAPIPTVLPNGAAPSFDPNKGSMEDFVRWRNGG